MVTPYIHIINTTAAEKRILNMRSSVFAHMLKTRGWKYRSFLFYLRIFKYIAFAPHRGKFLELYYTLMRYLDDVVDGDVPLAANYANETEYILEKIRFAENPAAPKDDVEALMKYCLELGQKFGADFSSETKDILESLLFDAQRRRCRKVFDEEELKHHFHVLDIRGTIRATLKIFKDDPDKYLSLEPLGMACRYQYDIEDIETDLAAGFINIPREACEQWGITPASLEHASSPEVQRWLRHHAEEGLALLEEHHRRMKQVRFSLLQRATFKVVYEMPARKTFQQTLVNIKPHPAP